MSFGFSSVADQQQGSLGFAHNCLERLRIPQQIRAIQDQNISPLFPHRAQQGRSVLEINLAVMHWKKRQVASIVDVSLFYRPQVPIGRAGPLYFKGCPALS